MDRVRYFVISENENIKKLLAEVFTENIRMLTDLDELKASIGQFGDKEGALFFDYEFFENALANEAEKQQIFELMGQIKDSLIIPICMVKDFATEICRESIPFIYDVIYLDENETLLQNRLRNIRRRIVLEAVVNDVLNMTDRENGQEKLFTERFNLFKMLSYLASVTYQHCATKGIKYELAIGEDVPEFLIGNRIHLNQVFLNIMSSAVQRSQDGGKVVFRVEKASQRDDKVRLKFVIEGSGISLGLSNKLVQLSKGNVEVEYIDENNSRLCLYFDAKVDKNGEITDSDTEAAAFANMKAAAIGRNTSGRVHTVKTLEALNIQVDTFDDVAAFKKSFEGIKLAGNLYNVCIVDGDMGEDESIVKEIRHTPGHSSAIIIVNSYNTDRLRMEFLKAGANGVIGKPISKTGIYNTLMQVKGRKISVEKKQIQKSFSLMGKRVLIAESNDLSMEIAVSVLRQTGAIVDCARNGIGAVNTFSMGADGKYDLIITGVKMVDMEGAELIREVRNTERADRTIPIVAMKGTGEECYMEDAMEAGATGIITKPLEIKDLNRVLSLCQE